MRIILFVFVLLAFVQNLFASEIKKQAEKSISGIFGKDKTLTFKKFALPKDTKNNIEKKVQQQFFAQEVYTWKITQKDSVCGFAILDNVLGKALPITFLVVFDAKGSILSTEIVKYREAYGGQISEKGWNLKFIGKNANSTFVVGKDVDGISGATISVISVTKGIEKLSLLIQEIKTKL
ncbi:FMN-binding protein [bacterium]|nr:FMN-binding protein [bacterium]